MIDQKDIRQKLPAAVRRARGTHAGLWLDKYIRDQQRGNDKSRCSLVEEVAELPEPPEYTAWFGRWQAMLRKYNAQTRPLRVRGRMVVGLGSELRRTPSICLHI